MSTPAAPLTLCPSSIPYAWDRILRQIPMLTADSVLLAPSFRELKPPNRTRMKCTKSRRTQKSFPLPYSA